MNPLWKFLAVNSLKVKTLLSYLSIVRLYIYPINNLISFAHPSITMRFSIAPFKYNNLLFARSHISISSNHSIFSTSHQPSAVCMSMPVCSCSALLQSCSRFVFVIRTSYDSRYRRHFVFLMLYTTVSAA